METFDGHIRGITPAYAGKSARATSLPSWPMGSPPHMRGKGNSLGFSGVIVGITPAYAGKSTMEYLSSPVERDHPRICGEKENLLHQEEDGAGSPPHMRGKGWLAYCTKLGLGITPAYAGKRLKRSRSTVPPVAIVPLFPSVCNKPVVSDGSPAGRDAPLFLPAENAVPASPAYNLRSL